MDENKSIVKVFSIKDGGHRYYVQEMPGLWGLGRDYAIMKDRERFYYGGRMKTKQEAVAWLLKRLLVEMGLRSIDLCP